MNEIRNIPGLEIVTDDQGTPQNITARFQRPIKSLSHMSKPVRHYLQEVRPMGTTRITLLFDNNQTYTQELERVHLAEMPSSAKRNLLSIARSILEEARTPHPFVSVLGNISSPLSAVEIMISQSKVK